MFDIWPNQAIRPAAIPSGDTVSQVFDAAVRMRGSKVAVRQKEFGLWKETSWAGMGDAVREIGMGLVALGLQPGDVVSILANTRQEWSFADYGIICAGGVSNGIYPTDAPPQCEYLLTDSASVFCVVEDEEQLDKILAVRGAVPTLRKIIVIETEGLRHFSDPQVMTLAELRRLGAEAHAADTRSGSAASPAAGLRISPSSSTPPARPASPRAR